jgi:hypothetical protein
MKKTLILAATIVVAGCGSVAKRATPPPPRLPRALAQDFAQRADEIARRLDAGDGCGALAAATTLQHRSIALVGRVPPAYQETLQGTINDLVARIRCTPPAPPPPTEPAAPVAPPAHDNGKHKGEKKHGDEHGKKHGKHDEDEGD